MPFMLMLNVIMLNVVMLNIMVPKYLAELNKVPSIKNNLATLTNLYQKFYFNTCSALNVLKLFNLTLTLHKIS
jgi:hypothetical protein